MESKHKTPDPTSPTTYTESYRGFALSLDFGPGGVRAIADGPVQWLTPRLYSWIGALEQVRALVDRYLAAKESCARIQQRRELAHGARGWSVGAVELVTRRPAVKP